MKDNDKVLSDIFAVSEEIYKDMSQGISRTDHTGVYDYITRLGRMLSDADRTSFWKWDRRSHTLWTASAIGTEKIVIPDSSGLVGKSLAEKRVVICNDPYNDPDFNADVDKKTGYVTKSVLVMPVADMNGQFIGAYQAINKLGKGEGFGEADCRRLSLAAIICGIALESEMFLDESHHDKLTGLKNRMGFYHDFSRYLKLLESGERLSLFISDIDKFKRINDTYGHNAGDAVLKHTAEILSASCRETDGIYRWGGEEFVMIMCGADRSFCAEKAEEIRVKIMNSVCCTEETDIRLTMSFGVVGYDPQKTIEENISAADEKLYTAKEIGRNKVIC